MEIYVCYCTQTKFEAIILNMRLCFKAKFLLDDFRNKVCCSDKSGCMVGLFQATTDELLKINHSTLEIRYKQRKLSINRKTVSPQCPIAKQLIVLKSEL